MTWRYLGLEVRGHLSEHDNSEEHKSEIGLVDYVSIVVTYMGNPETKREEVSLFSYSNDLSIL